MYYPQLLYGVNLGRIPVDRVALPSTIYQELDAGSLKSIEALAASRNLIVLSHGFVRSPLFFSIDAIHLGRQVLAVDPVPEGRGTTELERFDTPMLYTLMRRPRRLLADLTAMGVRVFKGELALYVKCPYGVQGL